MKLPMLPQLVLDRRWFTIESDFTHYLSSGDWTSITETNSTVAESDAAGGILVLNTVDTANTAAGVETTCELFKFAADKPMVAEGRIQYTEVNTNQAGIVFGFADATGVGSVVDGGASVNINSSGCFLYKLTGETVWRFVLENNGTVASGTSDTTAGGSSYQTLRIEITTPDATKVEATAFVDGVQIKDSNGNPIVLSVAHASSTEMNFAFIVKAGDAGAQAALVDYLAAAQIR